MAKTLMSDAIEQINAKNSYDYSYEKVSSSKEIDKRVAEVRSAIASGKVKNAIVKNGTPDGDTVSKVKLTEQGETRFLMPFEACSASTVLITMTISWLSRYRILTP